MPNKRKKEELPQCDCDWMDAIQSTMVYQGHYWCKRCGGTMGPALRKEDGSLQWGREVTFRD